MRLIIVRHLKFCNITYGWFYKWVKRDNKAEGNGTGKMLWLRAIAILALCSLFLYVAFIIFAWTVAVLVDDDYYPFAYVI